MIKNIKKRIIELKESYIANKDKTCRVKAVWKRDDNCYRYYPQYKKWIFWFDVEFIIIGESSMEKAWSVLFKYLKGHMDPQKNYVEYKTKEELFREYDG